MKLIAPLFLMVVGLTVCHTAFAQSPFVWQVQVGDSGSDESEAIISTRDGGCAAAGFTGLYFPGVYGPFSMGFVTKLSAEGMIEWQVRLGGSGDCELHCITQCSDGGYIAGGWSEATDHDAAVGQGHMWVVRLDSLGNELWNHRYGGSYNEYLSQILQTSDSGFILAGETGSDDGDVTGFHSSKNTTEPPPDVWIVNIGSQGVLRYEKAIGGSLDDEVSSIIPTNDGGYAFVGSTESTDGDINAPLHGMRDLWVVKLDSSLHYIEWSKTYGGSLVNDGTYISENSAGEFDVTGITDSYDGEVLDTSNVGKCWLLHLGSMGGLLSQYSIRSGPRSIMAPLCPPSMNRVLLGNFIYGDTGTNPIGYGIDEYDTATGGQWSWFFPLNGPNSFFSFNTFNSVAWDGAESFFAAGSNGGDSGITATGASVVKLSLSSAAVSVRAGSAAPDIISHPSSSPNPTGEGAVITFGISQEAYVKINLFDVLGVPVSGFRVLGSGGEGFEGLFEPGNHEVPLSLQGLPSGTYYARILTAFGNVATVKLVKEQ